MINKDNFLHFKKGLDFNDLIIMKTIIQARLNQLSNSN